MKEESIKVKRGDMRFREEKGIKEGHVSGSVAEVRTAERTHSDI